MTSQTPFHDLDEEPRLLDIYYGSYLRARDATLNRPDRETRDLAYTQQLWQRLGMEPWSRFVCVTVAGSKGKGSTTAMLASILAAGGARVGTVTSPHLLAFRERIRIDGHSISPAQLDGALAVVAPAVQALSAEIVPPHYLGPGGIVLAMAMPLFRAADVTVCVIEAGRGGEFDEARLVQADVSVLTRVMREHTAQLGPTIAAIAETKARITHPGSPLVIAPQDATAYPPIRRVAHEIGSPLHLVGDGLVVQHIDATQAILTCDLALGDRHFDQLAIGLPGEHQIENAAAAITAARALAARGLDVTDDAIRAGLRRVRVPGRLQRLSDQPLVLVDGAINAASARQACAHFRAYPCRRRTAIVAIPAAKDLAGVCAEVAPYVDTLIVTEVPSVRLTWHPQALQIAASYHADARLHRPAEAAFAAALAAAHEDDGILILGTQTFVANALHYWEADASRLW